MLLIAIDLEGLMTACSEIYHRLIREVDFYLSTRIILNTLKELREEVLAHLYRQHEIIQFIILVDIRKEAADNHSEAITSNRPSSMFTGGARTEVLAGNKDTT